jgi:citrate synthase
MNRSRYPEPTVEAVADWWSTSVTRIAPGEVEHRGVPVQDLIGTDLVGAMWFLVRGDRPSPAQARLLEAAMVAAMDHGPQAPSIAVARMAITCGTGTNNAMASAVNTLGDNHGGAGQECVQLLDEIVAEAGDDAPSTVARAVVARWRERSPYLPGFGHRFHPRDPRRDPLLTRVRQAVDDGTVAGRHLDAALAVEALLAEGRERPAQQGPDPPIDPADVHPPLTVLRRGACRAHPDARRPQAGDRNRARLPGIGGHPAASSRARCGRASRWRRHRARRGSRGRRAAAPAATIRTICRPHFVAA